MARRGIFCLYDRPTRKARMWDGTTFSPASGHTYGVPESDELEVGEALVGEGTGWVEITLAQLVELQFLIGYSEPGGGSASASFSASADGCSVSGGGTLTPSAAEYPGADEYVLAEGKEPQILLPSGKYGFAGSTTPLPYVFNANSSTVDPDLEEILWKDEAIDGSSSVVLRMWTRQALTLESEHIAVLPGSPDKYYVYAPAIVSLGLAVSGMDTNYPYALSVGGELSFIQSQAPADISGQYNPIVLYWVGLWFIGTGTANEGVVYYDEPVGDPNDPENGWSEYNPILDYDPSPLPNQPEATDPNYSDASKFGAPVKIAGAVEIELHSGTIQIPLWYHYTADAGSVGQEIEGEGEEGTHVPSIPTLSGSFSISPPLAFQPALCGTYGGIYDKLTGEPLP